MFDYLRLLNQRNAMEGILTPDKACSHCKTVIPTGQKFCTSCGYPEEGSEQEKAKFHADRVMNQSKTNDAPKLIRQARNTLFAIGGITFLYGLYEYATMPDMAVLVAYLILTAIYVTLGFWSQRKPLISLVLGLLVYLTIHVLSALVEPETIVKGIILKVVIIFFLVKGINSALHLRKSR